MAKAGIHAKFLVDLGWACIGMLSVKIDVAFRDACKQLAGILSQGSDIQGEIPAGSKQG